MKEYCIFCIYSGGKPFILNTYYNIMDAKVKLYDMISLEEERHRPYFVDNDFFKNIFPSNLQNGKYFCIKERRVSDWTKFSDTNAKIEDNIIYFNNFKKTIDIN